MPDVSVPWGPAELTFALPDEWSVVQVARPSLRPAPEDWADRLAMAMAQPVSGLPLEKLLAARAGGRVALIVEDLTRHSPLPEILPRVLRELEHARVEPGRVEVVFATGMHPPMTADQAAGKLGCGGAGLAWRCNPWQGADAYVSIGCIEGLDVQIDRGVADADLRILVSSVSPHLQAGFGGGYKMVLPGCASLETIRQFHRRGVGRTFHRQAGTDGQQNVLRRLIDAAGRRLDARRGASFAVQYLLDESDRPTSVAAGEVLPVQQMLAKQCAVACGVVADEPADVVIANAHPRDLDLWQSLKCIPNTLWAARPGGVVICLSRCPAGLHGMNVPPLPVSGRCARRLIRWLGPDALAALAIRLLPALAGDAAFFVRLAARALHRNPILLVSPTLAEAGLRFPGLEIFPSVEPALRAARDLLGEGPRKVIVFPAGGVTYPIASETPGGRS